MQNTLLNCNYAINNLAYLKIILQWFFIMQISIILTNYNDQFTTANIATNDCQHYEDSHYGLIIIADITISYCCCFKLLKL